MEDVEQPAATERFIESARIGEARRKRVVRKHGVDREAQVVGSLAIAMKFDSLNKKSPQNGDLGA